MSIALSLAVVVVLLRFRLEFNRQLVISKPKLPEARSFITGIVFLLAILIVYGTFAPYSGILPYGIYNIIFFILAVTQVYLLWDILNKNSQRLSELMLFRSSGGERTCSCGWENPGPARFCSRCGSLLQ